MKSKAQVGHTPLPRPIRKNTTSIRAGEWFGCGAKITTESWKGFLAARKAYWEQKDKDKSI